MRQDLLHSPEGRSAEYRYLFIERPFFGGEEAAGDENDESRKNEVK